MAKKEVDKEETKDATPAAPTTPPDPPPAAPALPPIPGVIAEVEIPAGRIGVFSMRVMNGVMLVQEGVNMVRKSFDPKKPIKVKIFQPGK